MTYSIVGSSWSRLVYATIPRAIRFRLLFTNPFLDLRPSRLGRTHRKHTRVRYTSILCLCGNRSKRFETLRDTAAGHRSRHKIAIISSRSESSDDTARGGDSDGSTTAALCVFESLYVALELQTIGRESEYNIVLNKLIVYPRGLCIFAIQYY